MKNNYIARGQQYQRYQVVISKFVSKFVYCTLHLQVSFLNTKHLNCHWCDFDTFVNVRLTKYENIEGYERFVHGEMI